MPEQPSTPPSSAALFEALKAYSSEEAVERARFRYMKWCSGLPAPTSLLNHHLCVLQLMEEESHNPEMKKDDRVVDAVLDGTGVRKTGDSVEDFSRDGDGGPWTVIWRQISARYGVEMGFRSVTGKLFSWEFFD